MDDNTLKRQAQEVIAQIRVILLHDWDPIGINDFPDASDEYDSYAGGVHDLLLKGATEEELINHLRLIEIERMQHIGVIENRGIASRNLLKIDIPYKK